MDNCRDIFSSLLTALNDAELTAQGAAAELLDSWVGEHGVNNDVIIRTATGADNRGSPLLIACECDLPAACSALLRRKADVNYAHPGAHGSQPLLRCAEMGYDACLGVLLSSAELRITDARTREYNLVLGQTFPQYEAGGRSALLLAVEACRFESVKLLLAHPAARQLLDATDSFGRKPLEAAMEMVVLKVMHKQILSTQHTHSSKDDAHLNSLSLSFNSLSPRLSLSLARSLTPSLPPSLPPPFLPPSLPPSLHFSFFSHAHSPIHPLSIHLLS